MVKKEYVIGDNSFAREELIKFGKQHYPKFYWIYRGVGIGLMFMGTMFAIIYAACATTFNRHDFEGIEENPLNIFYVITIIFAVIAAIGCVLFAYSFIRKIPEESYIKHAIAYYTKLDANTKLRQARIAAAEKRKDDTSDKKDVADLLKYKELLDAGIITQEEFEKKKKEYLGK